LGYVILSLLKDGGVILSLSKDAEGGPVLRRLGEGGRAPLVSSGVGLYTAIFLPCCAAQFSKKDFRCNPSRELKVNYQL
jgi:hypothetical protein